MTNLDLDETQIRQRLARPSSLPHRMTFWYAGSLLILALLTLAGHWSVQRLVSEGRRDAAIINIAGRQRMLSQKIAKNVALLANAPDESAAAPLRVELASALSTWRLAHEQLVFGDADVGLPATTDPAILASMGRAGTALGTVADAAALSLRPSDEPAAAASAAVAVAMTEPVFLAEMERAVGLYEQRAAQHVAQSERTILAFGGATLLVFAFVAAFIFHPLVRRVRRALRQEREVAEAAVLARPSATPRPRGARPLPRRRARSRTRTRTAYTREPGVTHGTRRRPSPAVGPRRGRGPACRVSSCNIMSCRRRKRRATASRLPSLLGGRRTCRRAPKGRHRRVRNRPPRGSDEQRQFLVLASRQPIGRRRELWGASSGPPAAGASSP